MISDIRDEDLLIEVYRSNTNDDMIPYEAIRIVHIPTTTTMIRVLKHGETLRQAKKSMVEDLWLKLNALDVMETVEYDGGYDA